MRALFCGLCLTLALASTASADPAPNASPATMIEPDSTDGARVLPLTSAANVRDLGGLDSARGTIPSDRFVRAANLENLTPADRSTLYSHHVVLDIDLRTPDEDRAHPDALSHDPNVRYLPISLFGDTHVLSNVPPSLRQMYLDALANNQPEFKQVFEAIAAAGPGGILYHCTVGKDRTGMISAMLLDLAGTPRAEIVHDYAVSAYYLKPVMTSTEMQATLAKHPGLVALMGSLPQAIAAFLDELDSRYGGTAGYLKTIGVSDVDIAKLRARLAS